MSGPTSFRTSRAIWRRNDRIWRRNDETRRDPPDLRAAQGPQADRAAEDLPPATYLPSEDRTQDPHILRAIGRAWGWRRRMEAGEFNTVSDLAKAVGLREGKWRRE